MNTEHNQIDIKKLYPAERQQLIIDLIREEKRVEVDDLVERFGVSGATIRSDLRALEQRHLVQRTHGGALLQDLVVDAAEQPEVEPIYVERISKNTKAKVAIGKLAASLIEENDSIMLDDGSTTIQVVHALDSEKRISVLSNGLDIYHELVKYPLITVFSTGGKFNKEDLSFNGKVAEEVTSRFHAGKAILGTSGISMERGITTPSEEKAELKKAMINNSSKVIIVADYSKIDRNSFIEVCPIEGIDVLVTDNHVPADVIEKFRSNGIEVLVANLM